MITQLWLSKIRTPTLESVLSPLQRVTHSHTTILVMTRFFQYPCSENQRPVPGSRFCSRQGLNTYKKKSSRHSGKRPYHSLEFPWKSALEVRWGVELCAHTRLCRFTFPCCLCRMRYQSRFVHTDRVSFYDRGRLKHSSVVLVWRYDTAGVSRTPWKHIWHVHLMEGTNITGQI